MTPFSIDRTRSVTDILLQHPDALIVLAAAGIDSCCGGHESLELAAQHAGADIETLCRTLADARSAPDCAPTCECREAGR
jgi:iron-sulfur cluster repair protein YtfE (RIC family)